MRINILVMDKMGHRIPEESYAGELPEPLTLTDLEAAMKKDRWRMAFPWRQTKPGETNALFKKGSKMASVTATKGKAN